MKSELDKLFDDRKTKIEAADAAAADAAAKEKVFQNAALAVLDAHIVPVLREVETDLRQRGHEAELMIRGAGFVYPSATLKFRVIEKRPQAAYYSASSITFTSKLKPEEFETRVELWVKGGKREHLGSGPSSQKLAAVDKPWVEHLVLAFVREVLEGV